MHDLPVSDVVEFVTVLQGVVGHVHAVPIPSRESKALGRFAEGVASYFGRELKRFSVE